MIGIASYRIQLHKDMDFQKLEQQLGYLNELGISHLYLSPILKSRSGSMHGYDTVDPRQISPERGGIEGLNQLCQSIEQKFPKLKIILDIVPNHMGVGSDNPYWMDVLKQGPASAYYSWFDIYWQVRPKITVPVLGQALPLEIEAQKLVLKMEGKQAFIHYYEHRFPLNIKLPLGTRTLASALADQHYELMYWREGITELNYRRFFDITDLIAVRVNDEQVFQATHQYLFELIQKYKMIEGIRIDHVDGIKDPKAYLTKLRAHLPHHKIWVEKILEEGEYIRKDWPVCGETGYEFLNISSQLFISHLGFLNFFEGYKKIQNQWNSFIECVEAAKSELLDQLFTPEFNRLLALAYRISKPSHHKTSIAQALRQLSVSLPVYRSYFSVDAAPDSEDIKLVVNTITRVRQNHQSVEILTWLDDFLNDLLSDRMRQDEDFADFIYRWQQLSGPLMAKGLEDTAIYRFFPLLSLCNVGTFSSDHMIDGPRHAFHEFMSINRRFFAESMNASSTHDTKRSEDVHQRLNALSEFPELWFELYEQSAQYTTDPSISAQTRWFFLQTLIGSWPLEAVNSNYIERMQAYGIKAARETKQATSWLNINEDYETALNNWIEQFILKLKDNPAFKKLQQQVASLGAINSIASMALKVFAVGMPDFYQHTEVWNLSLVDPDNRRPVDFAGLNQQLKELQAIEQKTTKSQAFLQQLCLYWSNGNIKLWTTQRLLHIRQQYLDLCASGDYFPIETSGAKSRHLLAFARLNQTQLLLIIVPRLLRDAVDDSGLFINPEFWQDTEIILPLPWEQANLKNLITGETQQAQGTLAVELLLNHFPIAILSVETA